MEQLNVGTRIRVQLYNAVGQVAAIDDDTGEAYMRIRCRKSGTCWATVLNPSVLGGGFCLARFDSPIPDINNPARLADTWSVSYTDIVEQLPAVINKIGLYSRH